MPIQIYKCEKCKIDDEERLVKFSNQDEQVCKTCGEKMEIVPSFGNFKLKGPRWMGTTGGY
jgi:putative FmdB family regulatory protein